MGPTTEIDRWEKEKALQADEKKNVRNKIVLFT